MLKPARRGRSRPVTRRRNPLARRRARPPRGLRRPAARGAPRRSVSSTARRSPGAHPGEALERRQPRSAWSGATGWDTKDRQAREAEGEETHARGSEERRRPGGRPARRADDRGHGPSGRQPVGVGLEDHQKATRVRGREEEGHEQGHHRASIARGPGRPGRATAGRRPPGTAGRNGPAQERDHDAEGRPDHEVEAGARGRLRPGQGRSAPERRAGPRGRAPRRSPRGEGRRRWPGCRRRRRGSGRRASKGRRPRAGGRATAGARGHQRARASPGAGPRPADEHEEDEVVGADEGERGGDQQWRRPDARVVAARSKSSRPRRSRVVPSGEVRVGEEARGRERGRRRGRGRIAGRGRPGQCRAPPSPPPVATSSSAGQAVGGRQPQAPQPRSGSPTRTRGRRPPPAAGRQEEMASAAGSGSSDPTSHHSRLTRAGRCGSSSALFSKRNAPSSACCA